MFLLALLMLFTACFAQEADDGAEGFMIREIEIIGNHHTKEWVIRRELHFQVGDRILYDDLEAARNRLLNLQLFNNVFIEGDEEGTITVEVSEQFQYIPLVGLSATDGRTQDALTDLNKFFDIMTATAGFADLNYRGHGGTASGSFRFGASTGFALTYSTRWLSPRLPIRFKMGLRTLLVSDKHASVQDTSRRLRDQQVYVSFGSRGGAQTQIGAQLMFQRIVRKTPQLNERKQYRAYWLSPFAILDRRNLEWYPSSGFVSKVAFDAVSGDTPFVRSQYAVADYLPLSDRHRPALIALRLAGATATASTPDWAHYYFGFSSLLRGYSSVKSEASTYLLGDLELRIPVSREKLYNLPALGRYGRNIPFWWGLVFFGERAQLQLNGAREETWAAGAGLHIRVPWIQIVELVWAYNNDSEHDLVIQSGVLF
ncbi:BamA/TamA family outer membrane protein [bacterium]|nr:BamA/TamA family outer membrane protein [bacterium]